MMIMIMSRNGIVPPRRCTTTTTTTSLCFFLLVIQQLLVGKMIHGFSSPLPLLQTTPCSSSCSTQQQSNYKVKSSLSSISLRRSMTTLLSSSSSESDDQDSDTTTNEEVTTTTTTDATIIQETEKGGSSNNTSGGDKLRAATGIRPSLHPTTINAIAEALKVRAMNSTDMPLRISSTIQPLDIALTAGKIATTAIGRRQETSKVDNMIFTSEEEQVIAGRVIGVIMRLKELELLLYEKVKVVEWISKFNEYTTFGIVQQELKVIESEQEEQEELQKVIDLEIKNNPLLCMNRAECLLGLFLTTIEIPQLQKVNQTVIDNSIIDFLDEDRVEVLLS